MNTWQEKTFANMCKSEFDLIVISMYIPNAGVTFVAIFRVWDLGFCFDCIGGLPNPNLALHNGGLKEVDCHTLYV